MATISAANPSRKPLPMAQIDWIWPVSFALFGQKLGRKQKGSALRHLPSLRPSCRRSESLSSVAPILRTSAMSLSYLFTSPWHWGHLYFVKKGTFLFCIDRIG
jgi:hypothetical protein